MLPESQLSVVDYVVFAFVLVGSALIGVYYAWKSRKQTTNKEFLSGGQNMGVWPIALSMTASLMSATVVLGIPAEMFAHTIQYWISNIGAIGGILVTDLVFLPMFYSLKMNSVNKYLLKRYNSPGLRTASSLSFILVQALFNGAVVYGPALALSSVTPLSIPASIVSVGIVCTFYTTFGGMKAVIGTDVLQLLIMFAGLTMVAIQGTIDAGGIAETWRIAEEGHIINSFQWDYDYVYGSPTVWEVTLGMLTLWAGTFSTNQMCMQRFCSLPTLNKARMSLYISVPLTAIFLGVACYCGVVLFAVYSHCDPLILGKIHSPDQLMPFYVLESLSYIPGMTGLFIASVFSGSLSTLSSTLNSMTIVTWEDFLKKFCTVSPRMEKIITKLIAIFYGLITIGIGFLAQRIGSVLQVSLSLGGSIVGPLFGIFILAAVVPFSSGMGAIIGLLFSQGACLAINIYAMILTRPMIRVPTYTDRCPASYNISMTESNFSIPFEFTNSTMLDMRHQPKDIPWIFLISPFFIPFVGVAVCVITGVIASLFTGGLTAKVDPLYISPVIGGTANKLRKEKNLLEKEKLHQISNNSDYIRLKNGGQSEKEIIHRLSSV